MNKTNTIHHYLFDIKETIYGSPYEAIASDTRKCELICPSKRDAELQIISDFYDSVSPIIKENDTFIFDNNTNHLFLMRGAFTLKELHYRLVG
ncbi:MAG: hypothetical protein IKE52_07285 [Mogibacterium sp.]|nr:hypothetical protein [Mogibacterium sp.]